MQKANTTVMTSVTNPGADHPTLAVFGVDEVPAPRTLVDILDTTVSLFPDSMALVGADKSLTYRELAACVTEQTDSLAEHGIGHGDRVGVRVPSGTTDLYIAILAVLSAGAAYVPVDWDDTDSRAETVWNEAQVAAVYDAELSLTLHRSRHAADSAPARPSPGDDAWIIFTSGSTGTPKGVAVTHRSAAALVDAEARMYLASTEADPLGPGDRVMAGLSVAFDASCEEMWLAWRYGAALVAAPRDVVRSGDALDPWIAANRITAISTVPTLAAFWSEDILASIRLLIFGGEPLPLALSDRLTRHGREVWNTYGPTEATIIATGQLMGLPGTTETVRIGRPTPGWKLAVVDPATQQPVRWGDTGELIVGGVGLGRYLDPGKDAEAYAPVPGLGWDRAYRTGDLVIADRDGLVFVGRADDQIKFAGRRMELGEIDRALSTIPGVRAGAAAKRMTAAGSEVIVGYLAADADLDLTAARDHLRTVLPGGLAPGLCVIDELPVKTSGKVDRNALPWPLPGADADTDSPLPAGLRWLAEQWARQLGPLPLQPESNFFDLGGSSVAVAKLAVDLRTEYPATDIGALYDHPTLESMSSYLGTLDQKSGQRPAPAPIPRWSGIIQFLVVCAIYVVNAARYVLGSLLVVWALGFFFNAGWVPGLPLAPLAVGWLLLFSTPGRVLQGVVAARLLTAGVRPGAYPRGGWTHLRIWAAERFITYLKFEPLLGTPMTAALYRLFGCRVGRHVDLHTLPPVTGLAVIGRGTAIENEVDVNGHWIDGDTLHVGSIIIGEDVRIGMRTFVSPGARINDGAEVLPGSCVSAEVTDGLLLGGTPLTERGTAGLSWPEVTPHDAVADGAVSAVAPAPRRLLYAAGIAWASALPVIALLPGLFLILPGVVERQMYEEVFPVLAALTPVFTLLTIATWLGLVIITVRLCSTLIRPGYYPAGSTTAWALWLTHVLLQKTLTSTYFMYAGWLTPAFMRLLGARVGDDTEISTVETIPHLTSIGSRCFLADHSLCTLPRHRAGWVHVGTTVLGDGSFVGNSAIVGPDNDLPEQSLVAVLSSTPHHPGRGSSWLGRNAREIPRVQLDADTSRTFTPSPTLKSARALVEAGRFIPPVIAAYIDLFIVWAGTLIYMNAGTGWDGIRAVIIWSFPIVLAAGTVASIVPVVAKWMLVGRFRVGQHTLFSTFVWRGELADNFAELLAVPSLIRLSLGSPLYNWWARLMGTRIGRDVWCETWWLPEFDLITLGDGATVNRGTVLQTHLFHDRVMSLEPVTLRSGSTLGPNSFMLPGSTLGERTTVRPGSLVLRQDDVPPDSVWEGNPVVHVTVENHTADPAELEQTR